jgi:hypothetical protein
MCPTHVNGTVIVHWRGKFISNQTHTRCPLRICCENHTFMQECLFNLLCITVMQSIGKLWPHKTYSCKHKAHLTLTDALRRALKQSTLHSPSLMGGVSLVICKTTVCELSCTSRHVHFFFYCRTIYIIPDAMLCNENYTCHTVHYTLHNKSAI